MAGGAVQFQALYFQPGNPSFPTLPVPGAPILGWSRISFGDAVEIVPRTRVRRPSRGGSGGSGPGFAGWYLNQIWTSPQPVDFGEISSDEAITVTVHNTFRTAIELQSVDVVAGITITSPALPVTIGPFSSQAVVVAASLEGLASFDETVQWTYDIVTVDVRILGRRVLLFTGLPEGGVKEQLVFKTDIIRAKSGKEKAQSLRLAPRSVVMMPIRSTDDSIRAQLHNTVFGGSPKLRIGRLSWWEARPITQAVAALSTVVPYNTAYTSIRVGDTVAFALPDETFANGEVAEVAADSITLAEPIEADLPLGTHAVPVRFGYITKYPQLSIFPVAAEDMQLEFTTDDETDFSFVSPDEFDSHPVDGLPIIRANYMGSGEKRAEISRRTRELDGETGIMFSSGTEALGEYRTDATAVLQSPKALWEWRRFLHHLRGSWGRFYLPTFQNDLPLANDLMLGGAAFDVVHVGLKKFLNGAAPKRDVRIVTSTGEVYYRRIVSISDNGATEAIILDSGIPGIGLSPKSETMISFLHLSRIEGDVATFTHFHRNLSVLEFRARTVKE